jgi:hypothetical protein
MDDEERALLAQAAGAADGAAAAAAAGEPAAPPPLPPPAMGVDAAPELPDEVRLDTYDQSKPLAAGSLSTAQAVV